MDLRFCQLVESVASEETRGVGELASMIGRMKQSEHYKTAHEQMTLGATDRVVKNLLRAAMKN